MSNQIQPQTPPPSDEIDLGQLFQMIGNGFKRLFNFIGNIFKGIFNIIILFLLFLQKHFIKFAIAGVVGLAIGIFLDMNKEPKYISTWWWSPTSIVYNNCITILIFTMNLLKPKILRPWQKLWI